MNILTRTHRERYFRVLQQSMAEQTYRDFNWIVGSDLHSCDYYPDAIRLQKPIWQPMHIPQGMYFAPHNLYLNSLQEKVQDGWIMYLDDDDMFASPNSLQRIVDNLRNENEMVIWKVQITPQWIVPSHSFGNEIKAGDISGIGFAFHSKHLPVDWGTLSYGDFRVAMQLKNKGLKPRWVDWVLTRTQNGANNGRD